MTVSNNTNRKDYAPDGLTTVFPYDFRVDSADDLVVYSDGEVVTDGYTVDGIGDSEGGDVTFDDAPLSSVERLTLIREVAITQESSYPALGPFPAASHEAALDKLTFIAQQLQERTGRSGVAPIDADTDTDFTLPKYKAGGIWLWDVAEQKLVTSVAFSDYGVRKATDSEVQTGSTSATDAFVDPNQLKKYVNTTVDTITDLQAITYTPNDGQVVNVLGYYDASESRDWKFQWRATDLATECASDTQHGIYIPVDGVDASEGAFVRLYDGDANIYWFGAKANGTFDDSVAFNGVINLSPIACEVPYGEFLIKNSIDFSVGDYGVSFYAEKRPALYNYGESPTLKLGFDGDLIRITGPGSSTYFDITFKGIYFDGDAANRTAGTFIEMTNEARGLTLRNGQVVGFRDYGLYCNNAGGVAWHDFDIFNCGYNIYGDYLADSQFYGGQTGSGAGGGASWVQDNIYLLGVGGNCHFINHRPNFSAGIGVRIGGNVSRCSFIGGLCDQNLGGGFSLEDNCTAIKIQGMDIFDNGTTASKKYGVRVTTGQYANGFQGPAGIQIIGNNIFDRNMGTASEKMDTGIDLSTLGVVPLDRIAIVGNNLDLVSNPMPVFAGLKVNSDKVKSNTGIVTEVSGITAAILIDTTGVKSVTGIDVSALTSALTIDSTIVVHFASATNLDFVGNIIPVIESTTALGFRLNITTASATPGASVRIKWQVLN